MLFVRRRPTFGANLERLAKDEAKEIAKTIRFWYRKKYGLTVTDTRYLDATDQDMLTDYWAHYYHDQPAGEFEGGTDNFDQELAAMDAKMGILPDDFEDISNG